MGFSACHHKLLFIERVKQKGAHHGDDTHKGYGSAGCAVQHIGEDETQHDVEKSDDHRDEEGLSESFLELHGGGHRQHDEGGDDKDTGDSDGYGYGQSHKKRKDIIHALHLDVGNMCTIFVEGGVDEFIIKVGHGKNRDDGDNEYQNEVLPCDGQDTAEKVLVDVGVRLSAGDQDDGDTYR